MYILSIQQTCIWSDGPYPAGAPEVAHDGCLFRGGKKDTPKETWKPTSFYNTIPDGKKVIGDSLYKGMPEKCTISLPGHDKATKDLINRAKARQERYHGHTKEFNVMKHRFRHGNRSSDLKLSMHKTCLDTIHILMHFELINRPLMDVP
jgi:hypothetical protein